MNDDTMSETLLNMVGIPSERQVGQVQEALGEIIDRGESLGFTEFHVADSAQRVDGAWKKTALVAATCIRCESLVSSERFEAHAQRH